MCPIATCTAKLDYNTPRIAEARRCPKACGNLDRKVTTEEERDFTFRDIIDLMTGLGHHRLFFHCFRYPD